MGRTHSFHRFLFYKAYQVIGILNYITMIEDIRHKIEHALAGILAGEISSALSGKFSKKAVLQVLLSEVRSV